MRHTPTSRALDVLLRDFGGLHQFVTDRRAQGQAWRQISREIFDRTQVDVTHETLRNWFVEEPVASNGDAA